MTESIVGSYRRLSWGDGEHVSWYMLPFQRDGACHATETRERLLEELDAGRVTDVFVFSHGWNNDWRDVTDRYQSFIDGFAEMHRDRPPDALGADYQPLLVGIFWPSVILVASWEQAPAFAGAAPETDDPAELAAGLPAGDRERMVALLRRDSLDARATRELAELAVGLDGDSQAHAPEDGQPLELEEMIELWRELPGEAEPVADADASSFGTVDGAHGNAPEAAAFKLDPRNLLRMLTVRTMKDRAGVVGARGVAPLLHEILKLSDARVHLIGHSYGCKVCLSAVCSTLPPRSAESMLLLQPAVNHRCFASDADGKGNAGGYREALARVEQPILTTYSSHDQPLTRWFHRALTRKSDLLEPAAAAWPTPPSRFAALGGYGPAGAQPDTERVVIHDPGDPYPRGAPPLIAIDGSRGIDGHGSISNPFTWWALLDQVEKGI